jgi:hypothetical protein
MTTLVLLPGGKAFRLSSSPEVRPIDAMQFFLAVPVGEKAVLQEPYAVIPLVRI